MGKRLDLHDILVNLLGVNHCYYQPPENLKMDYPAIRYSKSKIETDKANNSVYAKRNKYELIVIDRLPDNSVIDKLLELPYCSYDRHYISDNLHHDVLTLYY